MCCCDFECREYPTDANAYELLEECGRGVSATVRQPGMDHTLCKHGHLDSSTVHAVRIFRRGRRCGRLGASRLMRSWL